MSEPESNSLQPRIRDHRWMRLALLIGLIAAATFAGVAALVFFFGLGVTTELKVTPSRKTTYITAPLRADGTVDYVAARNQRAGEGVTADNNAAVLLWQAVGSGPRSEETRDAFFKALGMPTPPEQENCFLALEKFAEGLPPQPEPTPAEAVPAEAVATDDAGTPLEAPQPPLTALDRLYNQLDEAMTRPWTKEEFADVDQWLKANESPLALVMQASQRPRLYEPAIATPDDQYPLISLELPLIQETRGLARALTARAMQRAAAGQIDEAWGDLMAVHRLSRLTAQGQTLVEALVGMALGRVACTSQLALLAHVKLTPEQIARMRADLDQLPPLPPIVDTLDTGERLTCLDSIFGVARQISGQAPAADAEDYLDEELASFRGSSVDWDRVFTLVNGWWDEHVAAAREPNRARRNEKLARLSEKIEQRIADGNQPHAKISIAIGSRQAVTNHLANQFYNLLFPAVSAACDAQDRAAMDLELTKLAFALAAYQADHGKYPEKLADLVPKYLAQVPDDVFSGAPIRYTVDSHGYVLHSFGRDGEDNSLPEAERKDVQDEGDDLVVRMPVAP